MTEKHPVNLASQTISVIAIVASTSLIVFFAEWYNPVLYGIMDGWHVLFFILVLLGSGFSMVFPFIQIKKSAHGAALGSGIIASPYTLMIILALTVFNEFEMLDFYTTLNAISVMASATVWCITSVYFMRKWSKLWNQQLVFWSDSDSATPV
ncbi:hypothetical protein K0U27_00565 [archaeon]|nr:hypothetical protein [archaeon]